MGSRRTARRNSAWTFRSPTGGSSRDMPRRSPTTPAPTGAGSGFSPTRPNVGQPRQSGPSCSTACRPHAALPGVPPGGGGGPGPSVRLRRNPRTTGGGRRSDPGRPVPDRRGRRGRHVAGGARARHADPARQPLVDELGRDYPPDPDGHHPSVAVIRTGRSSWSATIDDEFLRATSRDEHHFRLTKDLGFTSYMSVPLISDGDALGAVTLVFAGSGRRFGPDDLALAEELAAQVAAVVAKERRYEAEHRTAHLLQARLLPPTLPDVPGVEVAVRYLPGTQGAEVAATLRHGGRAQRPGRADDRRRRRPRRRRRRPHRPASPRGPGLGRSGGARENSSMPSSGAGTCSASTGSPLPLSAGSTRPPASWSWPPPDTHRRWLSRRPTPGFSRSTSAARSDLRPRRSRSGAACSTWRGAAALHRRHGRGTGCRPRGGHGPFGPDRGHWSGPSRTHVRAAHAGPGRAPHRRRRHPRHPDPGTLSRRSAVTEADDAQGGVS